MKIGLLIAIEKELKAFLAYGAEMERIAVCRREVWRTVIGRHEVFALRSGCGEIDAASGTTLLIDRFGCQAVFNFGVAGALRQGLRVEDLFLLRKVCHYDYDTSPVDPVAKHQYAEFPDEFIPLDDGLFRRALSLVPDLREAVGASGDRFVEVREDKLSLASLGCDLCDMESAAIARVCFLFGVPCLSVKCISDTFEGNGGDFLTNVNRGAKKAFGVILKLLENL